MPIVYNDPLQGRAREASRIPAPTRDVLMAQFAQVYEENPIKAADRMFELHRDAGNRWTRAGQAAFQRLDADSARARVKDAGLEGHLTVDDAGITAEALETLMERKRMELRRQDVFSRAEGGLAEGLGRFGVSIATTLSDPIGAGLNFVPIVGQVRYARWLNAARTLGGRAAIRAGVGAVEGAAGAALVEPLIYASRTAEQADYDAADSLMNVAFGGVLGSALHTTVGTIGEVFVRRPAATKAADAPAAALAQSMRPDDFQATVRAAVGQAIEGRQIDVDGIVRASEFVPDEERLIINQVREAIAKKEGDLKSVVDGPDGLAVALRGGDDVSERLSRTVAGRDADAKLIARDVAAQVAEEAKRLALSDHANAYALKRSRDAGQPDSIFQKWQSRAEENVRATRTEAESRIAQANQLIASLQSDMERLSRVNSAESSLSVLRQTAAAARTIDDLVDALPTELQANFRRRIQQGRAEGYVRGPGSKLAQPDAAELRPAMAEQRSDAQAAEASRAADEVIAAEPSRATSEDALTAIKEEEALATAALNDLYQRLGRELKSAEYDEIIEAATNAERWAKTAELATVCLTRGG